MRVPLVLWIVIGVDRVSLTMDTRPGNLTRESATCRVRDETIQITFYVSEHSLEERVDYVAQYTATDASSVGERKEYPLDTPLC